MALPKSLLKYALADAASGSEQLARAALRQRRRRPIGAVIRQVIPLFLAPPVLLGLLCLPVFASPAPTRDVSNFLLVLWEVHGAIAGGGIVLFVFLLETAKIASKTFTTVLLLAVESWILQASVYGMASTVAIGVAIGMVSTVSTVTWPVILAISLVAIANVVLLLLVLVRSLYFLGDRALSSLQRKLLLQESAGRTTRKAASHVCTKKMLETLEGSRVDDMVSTLFGLTRKSEFTQEIKSFWKRRIVDINLAEVERVAEGLNSQSDVQEKSLVVMKGVGETVQKGHVLFASKRKMSAWQRFTLRRAIAWGPPDENDEPILDVVASELSAGAIERDMTLFSEAVDTCIDLVNVCLSSVKQLGLSAEDVNQFSDEVVAVRRMMSSGLEEAIKARTDELALASRRAVHRLTRAAAIGKNRSALMSFCWLYVDLRREILRQGLHKEAVYKDLYWRGLTELARFVPSDGEASEQDNAFDVIAHECVEWTLVQMFKEAIQEQADDFESLLEAHRIAFDFARLRAQRNRRSSVEDLDEPEPASCWIELGAWTIYLLNAGLISSTFATDVLKRLASRYGTAQDLIEATVEACHSDDEERSELSSWILWTKPEGVAHFTDSHGALIAATLAMGILRWEGRAGVANQVEGAHDLQHYVSELLKGIAEGNGSFVGAFKLLGLLSEENIASLTAVGNSFEAAKQAQDSRERAQVRASELDDELVKAFTSRLVKQYLDRSVVHALPAYFSVSPEPLSDDKIESLGYNELLPKEWFVPSHRDIHLDNVTENLAEGVDGGEISAIVRRAAEAGTAFDVDLSTLLDEIARRCPADQQGLLFLSSDVKWSTLYRHPAFDGQRAHLVHAEQRGTFAGKPLFYTTKVKPLLAVYLPPCATSVLYEVPTQGLTESGVTIEIIDDAKAEEIVSQWERDGRTFTVEDRAHEVEQLLERVLFRLRLRTTSTTHDAIAFRAILTDEADAADEEPEA